MVNQRRVRAVSEVYLCFGDPFSDDRRELGGRDAVAAIIVDEVGELGLKRESHELFSAVVFIDPSVTCLSVKRQGDGFADSGLRSEVFSPHDRAALTTVTENNWRPSANDIGAMTLDVSSAHMFVEKLHDRISENVRRRIAEIVLGDWTVAIGLLRWASHGFTAREHET